MKLQRKILLAPGAPGSPLKWRADALSTVAVDWNSVNDPGLQSGQGITTSDAGYNEASLTRIARDTTVKPGTQAASWKVSVQAADRDYYNPTTAQRTEMAMSNPLRYDRTDRLFITGDEAWIAQQIRLGATFPINATYSPTDQWQIVTQLKQEGGFGSPVQSLKVQEGQWIYARTTNDPNNQSPPGFQLRFYLGPALTQTWTKILWHVRFDSDPSRGFVEMFGDLGDGLGMRTLLPLQYQATQKISDGLGGDNWPAGTNIPVQLRCGIYRNVVLAADDDAWFAGVAVAWSRSVAEAVAFR